MADALKMRVCVCVSVPRAAAPLHGSAPTFTIVTIIIIIIIIITVSSSSTQSLFTTSALAAETEC